VLLLFLLLFIVVRDVQFHSAMRPWLPLATMHPNWRTLGIRGKYFAIAVPVLLIAANILLAWYTIDADIRFRDERHRHNVPAGVLIPGKG
jgi:hypothetical protein